jgi:hypothetical protein
MQIEMKIIGELTEMQDIISVLHFRATNAMIQKTLDADAAEREPVAEPAAINSAFGVMEAVTAAIEPVIRAVNTDKLLEMLAVKPEPGVEPPVVAGGRITEVNVGNLIDVLTAVEPAADPVKAQLIEMLQKSEEADAVDPLLNGAATSTAASETNAPSAVSAPAADPLLIAEPVAPAEEALPAAEIPDDDELQRLAIKFVGKTGQKGSIAVGKLVREFGVPQLCQIPAERRLEFVARLNALAV